MAVAQRNGTACWRIGAAVLLMFVTVTHAKAEDLEAATDARLGDYKAAIERWTIFAQQGDADSAYHLGQAYETGRGVPQDLQQAQHWYATAATGGSGPAAYAMGVLAESRERPDGLPQDLGAAIGWYRRALAAGDPRAETRLAALGAGEEASTVEVPAARDHAPAKTEVKAVPPKASEPTAIFERAITIWREHGLEGTDSTAIAALVAAAKQGQPLAQYDLAYAYEHGLGVPAAPERAYAWYRRAQMSNGPERLREAAATNSHVLGDRLSDAQKQAAARIDTE